MNRAQCWLFVWVGLALACLCAGCKTPPEPAPRPPPQKEIVEVRLPPPPPEIIEVPLTLQPITADLVGLIGAETLPLFQYYISNQVILYRESSELRTKNVGRSLELTSAFSRDMVTIDGMTKGEVISVGTTSGGKMTLDASFEPDSQLTLRFTQNRDGYFDLDTQNGTLMYGGTEYQVLADRMTRLLINMENKSDVQDYNRYAPGRSVEDSAYGSGGSYYDTPDQSRPENRNFSAPGGGRGYSVQVGAYINFDNAREAFDRLSAAGFSPAYETHGDYYRVLVSGITAVEMESVIRQLDYSGFSNLWIRE